MRDLRSDEQLIRAAAALSRMAPPEWETFLKAVELRAARRAEELVSSAPDILSIAQGRAQETRDLLGLLKDCRSAADKLEEKLRGTQAPTGNGPGRSHSRSSTPGF